MTQSGYQTSSATLHKIIDAQGLSAFDIEETIELKELQIPFGCQTIDEYESWFFETHSCKTSDEWYNKVGPWQAPYGSDAFYKNMMDKFGVKYPGQIDTHNQKVKETCNAKYGVDSYYQSEEAKNKLLEYIHSHDPKATNVWQLDFVKEKNKQTCLANHGVEYPAQSKDVLKRMEKSLLQNHGVTSPMKSPVLKENHRLACNASLGVDSPMKSEKVVAKYKVNFFEKYGVGFPSQVKFYCGQCDKSSIGFSTIIKYHKNHEPVTVTIANGESVLYTKHLD